MDQRQILVILVLLIVVAYTAVFIYNQMKDNVFIFQQRPPPDLETNKPPGPSCLGVPKDKYCEGNLRRYNPECNVDKWIYEQQECTYGCGNGTCLEKKCPAACDDGNLCTTEFCNESTNFDCKYTNLEGPQPGCDTVYSGCKYDFCSVGKCIVFEEANCCEDGSCENGENDGNSSLTIIRTVDAKRLQDLLNSFPELLAIDNGKTLSFDISEGSDTYHYFARKENGLFTASESLSVGGVNLHMTHLDFIKLEESPNICPKLKELMVDRTITIDIHVKGITMIPYCNLKDCLDYPGIEEDKQDCEYFGY